MQPFCNMQRVIEYVCLTHLFIPSMSKSGDIPSKVSLALHPQFLLPNKEAEHQPQRRKPQAQRKGPPDCYRITLLNDGLQRFREMPDLGGAGDDLVDEFVDVGPVAQHVAVEVGAQNTLEDDGAAGEADLRA